jgi:hypothetical protein
MQDRGCRSRGARSGPRQSAAPDQMLDVRESQGGGAPVDHLSALADLPASREYIEDPPANQGADARGLLKLGTKPRASSAMPA